MADVEVVYAHSFYAGSAHASGPLSGEIIGMLAATSPAEARAGLVACVDYAENKAWFHAALTTPGTWPSSRTRSRGPGAT